MAVDTVQINIRLKPSEKRDLIRIARSKDLTLSQLVRRAIRAQLDTPSPQPAGK